MFDDELNANDCIALQQLRNDNGEKWRLLHNTAGTC